MARFRPDTLLFEKYRIVRLLGQGGFAEVYLATHLHLKAPRALKILTRSGKVTRGLLGRMARRFQLEAQLGARFADEAHIVRVYDFEWDRAQDLLVLVMEYMPGGSVKDRLRQRPSGLNVEEVLRIAQDAAHGLAALHRRGYVHRDIKPSNLLYDRRGRVKIADLGIVQMPEHRTRLPSGGRRGHPGTPMYMSPEQEHTTAPLTPASDVYSLGLVLFEALTGRHPKTLRPGTRVRQLRPEVPAWLDELLAHMLAHTPQERPWDASEVLAWLERQGPPPESRAVHARGGFPARDAGTESETWDDLLETQEATEMEMGPPSPPMPAPPVTGPTPARETFPSTAPPAAQPSPPSSKRPAPVWKLAGTPIRSLALWKEWVLIGTPSHIVLWRGQKRPHMLHEHAGPITSLLPFGGENGWYFFSTGDDGRLLLWSYSDLRPVQTFTPAPTGLRFLALKPGSEPSPYVAGVDARGYLYLWYITQPEPLVHIPAGKATPAGLQWLDAHTLILAEAQGRLSVWTLAPGQARTLRKWRYPLSWSALAVNGNQAYLGAVDGWLWVVDLQTGRILRRTVAHQERVAALLPVGSRMVSVGWDQHLRIWDASLTLQQDILLSAIPLSLAGEGATFWVGCHDGSLFRFAGRRPRRTSG